jgi:adenosine deaminase
MVSKVEEKVVDLHSFVQGLPKVELHVHIEGTLEPGLMIKIAERNGILSEIVNEGETN